MILAVFFLGMVAGAVLFGIPLGLGIADRKVAAVREEIAAGKIIRIEDHRCEPPGAFYALSLQKWLIHVGEDIHSGDAWVCPGCTQVWVEDRGEWKQEQPQEGT